MSLPHERECHLPSQPPQRLTRTEYVQQPGALYPRWCHGLKGEHIQGDATVLCLDPTARPQSAQSDVAELHRLPWLASNGPQRTAIHPAAGRAGCFPSP